MRKVAIGIVAAMALAAASPANAQGIWLGVPGFGIGIGTGPGYGYGPYPSYGYGGAYYDGYGPNYTAGGFAYEPGYEYGSLGDRYVAYPYQPGVAYGDGTGGYRHTSRARHTRSYDYSPNVQTTREYSHRGTLSDRGYRTAVHSTEVRNR